MGRFVLGEMSLACLGLFALIPLRQRRGGAMERDLQCCCCVSQFLVVANDCWPISANIICSSENCHMGFASQTTVTPPARVIRAEVLRLLKHRMTRNVMSIKEEFCTNGWLVDLRLQLRNLTLLQSVADLDCPVPEK